MTDIPQPLLDGENAAPPVVGARIVFFEVGDDTRYVSTPDGDDFIAALGDGQPGELVALVLEDSDPMFNLWRARAADQQCYDVFEHEFFVTHAAPINDPSAYHAPLL